MAFPVLETTATTTGFVADSTPDINLPSGIQADDLLIILFRTGSGSGASPPSGWTELTESLDSGDGTTISYKWADGTESGTVAFSTVSARFTGIAFRISGAENPGTQPPEFSTITTGSDAAPNSGSRTPTGGAKDYLWLSLVAWASGPAVTNRTPPTNYSNDTGAGDSSGIVRVLGATRSHNASTENPGAWTIDSSAAWIGWTVAVHPEATVTDVDIFPDPLVIDLDFPAPTVTAGGGQAWQRIGGGTVVESNTTQASVGYPIEGTVAYDLMLMHCVGRNNSMNWDAEGWTPLGEGLLINSGLADKWLYKWADGTESGTQTTVDNLVGTNGWSAHISVWRGGLRGGNPLDVNETNDDTHTGLTMTAPSITTVTSGSFLLRSYSSAEVDAHSAHSEGTIDHNETEGIGTDHAHSATYVLNSGAPGSKGAATATQGASDRWIGRSFAFRPFPTAAGTITLTPEPLEVEVKVSSGWFTANGVHLTPYPLPISFDFPEPYLISGTTSVSLTPDPLVIQVEPLSPTVYRIFQPKPWTPNTLYSNEVLTDYQPLWTGMKFALPVWRESGTHDPLGWRQWYTNSGSTIDSTAASPAVYRNEETGYSDHILHHFGTNYNKPSWHLTTRLAYDPLLSGTTFMYVRPTTILQSGTMQWHQMFKLTNPETFWGARLNVSGSIYNDIWNSNLAQSDIASQTIDSGVWYPITWDWNGTTGVTRAFISGSQVINNTDGIDNNPASGFISIGSSTADALNTMDTEVAAFYVWDRILTPTERGYLEGDPWAPFRSARVDITPDPIEIPIEFPDPDVDRQFLFTPLYDPEELILVICDKDWNEIAATRQIHSFTLDEELGSAENTGVVAISEDDHVAQYIPNVDDEDSEPFRFQLYDGAQIIFAGLGDHTRRMLDEEGIIEFDGIQRGGELAERNFGRRDMLGWTVEETFRELLRDNIGRAPFATASSDALSFYVSGSFADHPPINAITGEQQSSQFYLNTIPLTTENDTFRIDLGEIKHIDAIRVIHEWESGRWYNWEIWTGHPGTPAQGEVITTRHDHTSQEPFGPNGVLVEFDDLSDRTVYINTYASGATAAERNKGEGGTKIHGVMVYQNLAEPGSETNYSIPWIENDDSGNVEVTNGVRVLHGGSFPGDNWSNTAMPGVSRFATPQVLRLSGSSTAEATHTFWGTSNAVYFTGPDAGTADFYVDGTIRASNVAIPSDSYQYEGFVVSNLSPSTSHTLRVVKKTGVINIDYFSGEYKGSWRSIQEDDPEVLYWNFSNHRIPTYVHNPGFYGGSAASLNFHGGADNLFFRFTGAAVRVITSKGPDGGVCRMTVDDEIVLGPEGTVPGNPPSLGGPNVIDTYDTVRTFHELLGEWEGDWGEHTLRIEHLGPSPSRTDGYQSDTDIDQIEGNWAHKVYIRSANDTNLALLQRLAEMTNTYLRLNYDGTADLLPAIGAYKGHIVREGENEGGTMEGGEVEGDWTNAVSAIVAIGRGTADQTLKVVVVDQPALDRLGIKVGKIEERDVVDAYLLVRRAWQALQDSKTPSRNYRMTWRGD